MLFKDFPNLYNSEQGNSQYLKIPKHLENIGYNIEFIKNINYMLGANILLCIIYLCLNWLKYSNRITNFITHDLFYSFTIFNLPNYIYCIGSHYHYYSNTNLS